MKRFYKNLKQQKTVEAFYKRYGRFPVRFWKRLRREGIEVVWVTIPEKDNHDS